MGSKKLGVNPVRSIPEPLDGELLSGSYTSVAGGEWVAPGRSAPADIEGIIIKALAGNTGTIYITETGQPWSQGFPLAKGESVSLGVDSFAKLHIWIATAGDGFAYLAIEQVRR